MQVSFNPSITHNRQCKRQNPAFGVSGSNIIGSAPQIVKLKLPRKGHPLDCYNNIMSLLDDHIPGKTVIDTKSIKDALAVVDEDDRNLIQTAIIQQFNIKLPSE